MLIHGLNKLLVDIYLLGLTFIIFLAISYLFGYLKNTNFNNTIFTEPMFWLSLAILFFYTCNFPFLFNLNDIILYKNVAKPLQQLLSLGNIILALGYLIMIICHLRKKLLLTK